MNGNANLNANNLSEQNVVDWKNKLNLQSIKIEELYSGTLNAGNTLSLPTLSSYNFIFCFFRTTDIVYSAYSYADLSQKPGDILYFQANSWGLSSTIKLLANRDGIYLEGDAQMPLIKVYGLKL